MSATRFNISQAARAVGISRMTMVRHIDKGNVSFKNDRKGKKYATADELIRVYGELQSHDITGYTTTKASRNDSNHDIAQCQKMFQNMESQVQELRSDKEDLRKRLDTAEQNLSLSLRLIEDKSTPKKKIKKEKKDTDGGESIDVEQMFRKKGKKKKKSKK